MVVEPWNFFFFFTFYYGKYLENSLVTAVFLTASSDGGNLVATAASLPCIIA